MTTSRSPSSPSRPVSRSRLVARGRWSNLLLFLALVAGGYVGYVYFSPRLTAYEVKAAVRASCNAYMRTIIQAESREEWHKDFMSRMRRIGLQLTEDQYHFDTDGDCNRKGCRCKAQVAFALTTPWPFLEDFFEIPPYRSVHRVDVDIDYRTSY